MAQLKILNMIVSYIIATFTTSEGRITRIIVFIIAAVLIVLTVYLGDIRKEKVKKMKQELAEQKMKTITKFGEGLEKGSK